MLPTFLVRNSILMFPEKNSYHPVHTRDEDCKHSDALREENIECFNKRHCTNRSWISV